MPVMSHLEEPAATPWESDGRAPTGTVVSIGSINADHALFGVPDDLGGLSFADGQLRTSGGKAANVAVFVARLGIPARLVGTVGSDDLADLALAGPRSAGVDLSAVARTYGDTGLSTVLVHGDGAKDIVLRLNANDDPAARTVVHRAMSVPDDGVVVLDAELEPVAFAVAVSRCTADGRILVVDPSPAGRIDDDTIAAATHLTPDHH